MSESRFVAERMQRQRLPIGLRPKDIYRLSDQTHTRWMRGASTYRFEHFWLVIEVLSSRRNKQLIDQTNEFWIFIHAESPGEVEKT